MNLQKRETEIRRVQRVETHRVRQRKSKSRDPGGGQEVNCAKKIS